MTALRVLLADDSAVSARVARALLERLGHRVEVARSRDEASARLANEPFDIAFVAFGGSTDDADRARRLVSECRTPRPYLVAIDGAVDGFDDTLPRPFARAALELVLGRAGAASTLDHTTFGRLRELTSDRDELRGLVREHVAGVHALVAEIRRARAEGDLATLQRAAHSIKGTAATFGSVRLSRLASAIERSASEPDTAERIDELEGEAARAAAALSAAVDG